MSLPNGSMACIIIVMIAGIAIPVALLLVLKKVTGGSYKAFFWGCFIMFLFAMTLESIIHQFVYSTDFGQKIWNNALWYAIYGGLMAGIFEETGRFIAFKYPLKKQWDKDANALTYAAGHGGFEMFNILFFGMLNNITYATVMKYPDKMAEVFEKATAEQAVQIQQVYDTLATTPAWMYLLAIVERCGALVLHFGLSVLVWFAVKKGKKKFYLFPLAILLHAFVDGGMTLVNKLTGSIAITEIFIWVLAIAVGAFSFMIWKKEATKESIKKS